MRRPRWTLGRMMGVIASTAVLLAVFREPFLIVLGLFGYAVILSLRDPPPRRPEEPLL